MSSETTESYMCFMFSIACKINLGLIKIMEIQEGEGGGGSLALEIRVGGGSTDPGNPVGSGGGQKTLPSIGGVWIFSGITQFS